MLGVIMRSSTQFSRGNRQNPWDRDQLYFRYGFWDLEPNANLMFHVTPKLSAILDSTELSPRASRSSKVESLGGPHEISVSYYGSLNRAVYTLIYLYRIWQVKKGIITIDDLSAIAGWDAAKSRTVAKYDSHMRVDAVRRSLVAHNPIVLGDSWVDDVTEDDFAILCFKNPCKHMFVRNLLTLGKRPDDTAIEALTQDSIQELRRYVAPRCYFGTHSEGLDGGIYHEIRRLLHEGKSQITYGESSKHLWKIGWGDYKDHIKKVFIGSSFYHKREWEGQDVIQFENITIDLREQPVNIEDLCLYRQEEQEFQLFRSMAMEKLLSCVTIYDALREAKSRNGGVEPFFWDTEFKKEDFASRFRLATWVDDGV